jgi:hypothetical protein
VDCADGQCRLAVINAAPELQAAGPEAFGWRFWRKQSEGGTAHHAGSAWRCLRPGAGGGRRCGSNWTLAALSAQLGPAGAVSARSRTTSNTHSRGAGAPPVRRTRVLGEPGGQCTHATQDRQRGQAFSKLRRTLVAIRYRNPVRCLSPPHSDVAGRGWRRWPSSSPRWRGGCRAPAEVPAEAPPALPPTAAWA